ncbi:MAG: DUF805 domain-containing protein [Brevundimonas sp.]
MTVSPDGDGVVRADDDARYAFHTRDVRAFIVQVGDRIGFEVDGDRAVDITLLSASPIPLGAPLHARLERPEPTTSPWGYFKRCMSKYVDGNGRASPAEYWWFVLFRVLLVGVPLLVGGIISIAVDPSGEAPVNIGGVLLVLGGLVYLVTILPNFCALIRRLHDVGLTGWLVLLNIIPYVGGFALLIMSVLPTQQAKNAHGPVPGSTVRPPE